MEADCVVSLHTRRRKPLWSLLLIPLTFGCGTAGVLPSRQPNAVEKLKSQARSMGIQTSPDEWTITGEVIFNPEGRDPEGPPEGGGLSCVGGGGPQSIRCAAATGPRSFDPGSPITVVFFGAGVCDGVAPTPPRITSSLGVHLYDMPIHFLVARGPAFDIAGWQGESVGRWPNARSGLSYQSEIDITFQAPPGYTLGFLPPGCVPLGSAGAICSARRPFTVPVPP